MALTPRKHQTLKAYRRSARLSQRAAAAALNITQAEYCRFENRQRIPRPKLAQKIAQKTGVPVETLLGLKKGA